MKLFSNSFSLKSGACFFYRKLQIRLLGAAPTRTQTLALSSDKKSSSGSLHNRILRLGDPNLSMATVLDQWVGEGNYTRGLELRKIICELMMYKRFKHALEVSLWMSNKRGYAVAPFDVALRLKLILKNFGIEQVENYFEKIPQKLKTFHVYLSLLNCCTMAKSIDKAESTMQIARDFGYVNKPIWYNLLMKLHYNLGNLGKVTDLLTQMDADGISPDQFTLFVCMSSCADSSNALAMAKILKIVESDPALNAGWKTHVVAARGYLKMGLLDEALAVLNKLEDKMVKAKKNDILFTLLIMLYSEAQKKGAVYRIWDWRRKQGKLTNKVYISIMRALRNFGDIEGMEKILDMWDSSGLSLDPRVPDFLVEAYCSAGCLDKAEAVVARETLRGCGPRVFAWCHLASGYLKENQGDEAMEALKKAVALCPSNIGDRMNLAACLKCLEKGGIQEKAQELVRSLRMRGLCGEGVMNDELSAEDDGDSLIEMFASEE